MRRRGVRMRDGAAQQAAPTMHQSLIRNNSTADSSHEIVPLLKRVISPPDSGPGLCMHTHAHLFSPRMRVSVRACQSRLLLFVILYVPR